MAESMQFNPDDPEIESCKACTMKHLSDALVSSKDPNLSEGLKGFYISGNLSHAGNHIVRLSPAVAAEIRNLRIDSLDDRLCMKITSADFERRVLELLDAVRDIEPSRPAIPGDTPLIKIAHRGCACQNH